MHGELRAGVERAEAGHDEGVPGDDTRLVGEGVVAGPAGVHRSQRAETGQGFEGRPWRRRRRGCRRGCRRRRGTPGRAVRAGAARSAGTRPRVAVAVKSVVRTSDVEAEPGVPQEFAEAHQAPAVLVAELPRRWCARSAGGRGPRRSAARPPSPVSIAAPPPGCATSATRVGVRRVGEPRNGHDGHRRPVPTEKASRHRAGGDVLGDVHDVAQSEPGVRELPYGRRVDRSGVGAGDTRQVGGHAVAPSASRRSSRSGAAGSAATAASTAGPPAPRLARALARTVASRPGAPGPPPLRADLADDRPAGPQRHGDPPGLLSGGAGPRRHAVPYHRGEGKRCRAGRRP